MKDSRFENMSENIEVPIEEINQAIQKGILSAEQIKQKRKKKKRITWVAIPLLAASLLFSVVSFPNQISHALANSPVLNSAYHYFYDTVGRKLIMQKAVTELNQTSESNGIKIKLTSVYYDGVEIGITGTMDGELKYNKGEEDEYNLDYNFFDGKGDSDPWLSNAQSQFSNTSKTHADFLITLDNPRGELDKDFTLPINIRAANITLGTWKFDVPVKQLPITKLNVNETIHYPEYGVDINVKDFVQGKYNTSYSMNITQDNPDLEVVVGEYSIPGKERNDYSQPIQSKEKRNGNEVKEISTNKLTAITSDTKSITFYPTVTKTENTPRAILLKRGVTLVTSLSSAKVKILKAEETEEELILTVRNFNTPKDISFGELESYMKYGFDISTINSNDGQEVFMNSTEIINGPNSKAELMDKKQSIFKVTLPKVNVGTTILDGKHYLYYDFGLYAESIALKPFTVDLTK